MCDCDHSQSAFEPNSQENLLQYIDVQNCKYLNAIYPVDVFSNRENESPLISDADDSLIIQIPFSVPVKLFEIQFRFSNEQSKHALLFKNRVIDFDDEDADAVIAQYKSSEQYYPIKPNLFPNVSLLQVYLKDNWNNNEQLELLHIELRGQSLQIIKDPVITLYEVAANPQDHPQIIGNTHSVGY